MVTEIVLALWLEGFIVLSAVLPVVLGIVAIVCVCVIGATPSKNKATYYRCDGRHRSDPRDPRNLP